jgi:hypothetical protein
LKVLLVLERLKKVKWQEVINILIIQLYKRQLFSQDQPVNTDWFDEVTRTGAYTQNNISVSGSTENIKYFSV